MGAPNIHGKGKICDLFKILYNFLSSSMKLTNQNIYNSCITIVNTDVFNYFLAASKHWLDVARLLQME